jgi:hypothetical protein
MLNAWTRQWRREMNAEEERVGLEKRDEQNGGWVGLTRFTTVWL